MILLVWVRLYPGTRPTLPRPSRETAASCEDQQRVSSPLVWLKPLTQSPSTLLTSVVLYISPRLGRTQSMEFPSTRSSYNNNLPTGVQNVTQCKIKSPVFVSPPHFYQADPSYLHQFQTGLQPSADKHNSVLWLEPASSIPGKVNIRLQLNILLKPVEGITLFKDVQEVMFPVLWFESLAEIPEGSLDMLLMLPTIIESSSLFIIVVSCILIIFFINYQNKRAGRKGKENAC